MFKRRRFPAEIVLVCVRWYCRCGISYRNLVEMMQERGVEVDPSTIMRWVHWRRGLEAAGEHQAPSLAWKQSGSD